MNKIDEILKIKELLDSGIITEKEFIELKSKIIELDKNEINPSEIIPNEIRKCPKCNSIINDNEQDCKYCNSDDEKINPQESSQEDNIIAANPAIKYAGYVIFIICLLIGVYVYYNNSNKESKIENVPLIKSKKENIIYPIKNLEINNNWTFFYNSKKSWGIAGVDKIENNGCIFISNDKNDSGTNAYTCRIIKLDSLGNMVLNKQLPKNVDNISYIDKNNYFLITDKTFQLVDSNGIIKLENDIGFEGEYYFFKIVKLNSSEIAIVGKLNRNGIILKLNLNLEIIQQFTFDYNSTIESIVSSENGDLYFSGGKNNKTWFGCLDNNFGVKWENNADKSGMIGNDIIKDSDNNFVIAGKEWSGARTFLLKIDSMGNVIWRKSYSGQSSEGGYGQDFIKLNNFYYLTTFESKNNSGGNLCSKIFKISTNGDVLKETYLKIDGRTISSSNIINYGNDSFLSIGRVEDYGKYDDKYRLIFSISKLNENIEYGKTFKYDY
jgi:hypothetical protein